MPLFTSNSDSAAYQHACRLLVISLVALCLLFELSARFGLPSVSLLLGRVDTERKLLLAESGRKDGDSKNVVILGNSLLLWGVNVSSLNYLGSGKFRYSRFVIENTQYWDWYFGLRSLLAQGAHPNAVVLLLGANHWLGNSIAGEFFAYTLLQPMDVFLLRKELDLDRTTASKYWFASWSSWLGNRASVRKNLLRLIFPDIEKFTRKLNSGPKYPEAQLAHKEAIKRLLDLKAVCQSFGVRLVIALHPTLNRREPFELIREAIVAVGLPVVAPVHLEYPQSFYADGLHLNQRGMEKFTQDLVSPLEEQLYSIEQKVASRP